MVEKIYNSPCSKINNYQEGTDKVIRPIKNPVVLEQILFFNDILLHQLARNHAKLGCFFCSLVEKGKFRVFYAFGGKQVYLPSI